MPVQVIFGYQFWLYATRLQSTAVKHGMARSSHCTLCWLTTSQHPATDFYGVCGNTDPLVTSPCNILLPIVCCKAATGNTSGSHWITLRLVGHCLRFQSSSTASISLSNLVRLDTSQHNGKMGRALEVGSCCPRVPGFWRQCNIFHAWFLTSGFQSTMNHLQTGQGLCQAKLHKLGLDTLDIHTCGQQQTMTYNISLTHAQTSD